MAQPMRGDRVEGLPVPPPAPIKARRMQGSMYLVVAMALLTLVGVLVVMRGARQVPVAVATRPLIAGEVLQDGDVRYIDVTATGTSAVGLLSPADVAAMSGRQLARNIAEGGFVAKPDLVVLGGVPQLRAMSVPIDQSRAAGGALTRADTVDVIDSSTGVGVFVVVGAHVLAAGDSTGETLAGSSHYAVTIAVDDAAALRLAVALTAGKVDVVRSTGATPAFASSPPTSVKRP